MLVIDLDGHQRGCTRCRPLALCAAGRELAEQVGTALIQAGRPLLTTSRRTAQA